MDSLKLATRPRGDSRFNVAVLGLLLVLCLLHIFATWGQVGLFSNDAARWLHEVERFSRGEAPYVDFYWAYAPAALWLFGAIGQVFGASLAVLWTTSSVVFVAIALLYYLYATEVLREGPTLPLVLAGILLAMAYSNFKSTPLPTGTYIPAAPVGVLFLLSAAVLLLRLPQVDGTGTALGTGMLCGLCILTKHDFWVPATYVVGIGFVHFWLSGTAQKRRRALVLLSSFATVILVGSLVVVSYGGWSTVVGVVRGFGQVGDFAGRGLPTWERLVVESTASALLALLVVLSLVIRRAVPGQRIGKFAWATLLVASAGVLVHVGMSIGIGTNLLNVDSATSGAHTLTAGYLDGWAYSWKGLIRGSVYLLIDRLQVHAFPLLLPIAMGVTVIIRWKALRPVEVRNTVVILLGLCIAARSRRVFEQVEWFNFLLEIPTYALLVKLLIPQRWAQSATRGLTVALWVLVALGAFSYWDLGVGPLTRRGSFERVATPRGNVGLMPRQAETYRQMLNTLNRLDPDGSRPLFALGPSGGMNYYLARRNPTPLTQGFRHWFGDPSAVIEGVLSSSPPALLLDHPFYRSQLIPLARLDFGSWEFEWVEEYWLYIDRPLFEQLIARCIVVATVPEKELTFYDCGPNRRP